MFSFDIIVCPFFYIFCSSHKIKYRSARQLRTRCRNTKRMTLLMSDKYVCENLNATFPRITRVRMRMQIMRCAKMKIIERST